MLPKSLPIPIRSRLAPTPSGLLHAGNALNFILTWSITRSQNGHLLLRIDDLDKARRRDKYIKDIFQTIDWLGLDYDDGPQSVEDFKKNWSQHLRQELYDKALLKLKEQGHLFACKCSRRDIQAISKDGSYPGTCTMRQLGFDQKNIAWRVHPPQGSLQLPIHQLVGANTSLELKGIDAFIVKQKDGFPAYQLGSVIDDEHFAINTIIRGLDLLDSTHYQLYLAHLMGKTGFLNTYFYHHGMILDEQGKKLSKSEKATALQSWREQGRKPDELFQKAANILGLKGPCNNGQMLVNMLKEELTI
ncbi:glutamate--tRNA ligase family protein [Lewinella cohaerens]|uniref:glutamate--tRNA ligase family protein n=1 Tax=Lewinella cohaerens TaxID=70995 RepID=UPI000364C2FF|nr:glutamate--tRNA ligase family protein [Lewinella cohaerens]